MSEGGVDSNSNKKSDLAYATGHDSTESIAGMFQHYYLDYASYVILDRAIPSIEDGLKPVQRRILHAMQRMDDGRFNKVANIIGQTMQYHPHGDMSIGDALVNLGQKDLLVETQGNWGNPLTGDGAAAPRYIEARVSEFARRVLFQPDLTEWVLSYDGRNQEPVTLPARFPLLLAQGADGIAVGLSTKILPHNAAELADACIQALRRQEFEILPDFSTGGTADFSDYRSGERGGKVKIRAKIETVSTKLLRISEIPYGTTTTGLIESIVSAAEKGKLKIRRVEDNTAQDVDILVHLPAATDPDKTIAGLYAFTQCETSISPNCCVIREGQPVFTNTTDLLKHNAFATRDTLERELEIQRDRLKEKILFMSLEIIFIEKKIYQRIEDCKSWDEVLDTIEAAFKPHRKKFYRELVRDDFAKLTELKIRRISKFDRKKADESLAALEGELAEVEKNLSQLTRYAVRFFKELKTKFLKDHKRRTEIASFSSVSKVDVAAASRRLYVDRADGFVGTSLRRDEFVTECSDLDEVIGIAQSGICKVVKVDKKALIGKNLLHVALYTRGDKHTTYCMLYRDGLRGPVIAKKFVIPAITREKVYDLTKGSKGTRVLFLAVGREALVEIVPKKEGRAKPKPVMIDFAELETKGRDIKGNIVFRGSVDKVYEMEWEEEG